MLPDNRMAQPDDSVAPISKIAQQRRLAAKPDLSREDPDWMLEIVQSEAKFTLTPRAIPLTQVSVSEFLQLLYEQYKISSTLSISVCKCERVR